MIEGLFVSGTFFEMLGVRAGRGRVLAADDDRAGAEPVAVISDALWKRRFAGKEDAVGRVLTIEGQPHTIVGVTPPGFFGPEVGAAFDVAVPLASGRLIDGPSNLLDRAAAHWLTIAIRFAGQSACRRGDQPPSFALRVDLVRQRCLPNTKDGSPTSSWQSHSRCSRSNAVSPVPARNMAVQC